MLKSSTEYDNATRLANGVVVVRCTADWCAACKQIAGQYNLLRTPGVSYYTIDVDQVDDFQDVAAATKLPCFFIFKDGQPRGQILGANLPALLREVTKLTSAN